MSDFGKELVESANEALAIADGRKTAPRTVEPKVIDVATVRRKLGLSQARFAARYGLSLATVRDWEQHRRHPDQVARVLLQVIEKEPDAVERALAQ